MVVSMPLTTTINAHDFSVKYTTSPSHCHQQQQRSAQCCASSTVASSNQCGRRFSELLAPSAFPFGGSSCPRPCSPFAHEAEGTTDLIEQQQQRQRQQQQQHEEFITSMRAQSSLGSDGTLSRSLSSPELLQLPMILLHANSTNSQSNSSHGLPSGILLTGTSATPSPLPTNELSLLSPTGMMLSGGSGKCSSSCSSQQHLNQYQHPFSSSSSLQSLRVQQSATDAVGAGGGGTVIRRPKMQLNGSSLLSIDIGRRGSNRKSGAASPCCPSSPQPMNNNTHHHHHHPTQRQRHSSGGSAQSDAKRNLISLSSVGNALQRTKRELKRTRLWHAFYAFALPMYTLAGALLFQALDGAYDDHMLEVYEQRCLDDREERMAELQRFCGTNPGEQCFQRMQQFLAMVEHCYRRWHEVNKTITHPMSDFTNAVIYAFSVYTTIGYGTISANSTSARIATVFYGVLGIPLFFAFIKEEGNACRNLFIRLYTIVKRFLQRRMAAASAKVPQPLRKLSASAYRSVLSSKARAPGIISARVGAAAGVVGGHGSADSECYPLAMSNNHNDASSDNNVLPPAATLTDGGRGEGLNSNHIAIPMESADEADSERENNNNNNSTPQAHRPASAPTAKSTRFCVQQQQQQSPVPPPPPYLRQCSDISLPPPSPLATSAPPSATTQTKSAHLKTSWKDASIGSARSLRHHRMSSGECESWLEQRRVFLCGVIMFIVYLFTVSTIFSLMTGWDWFTAFYFLFNSVALIGFGDVFPKQPRVILANMVFIVVGVVLFSMCYFILQEQIRVRAYEASRRARTSIAKYSQSLMLHTRPWSRRNSPAFDTRTFENHFDRLRKRRQSAPAITAVPHHHHHNNNAGDSKHNGGGGGGGGGSRHCSRNASSAYRNGSPPQKA